MTVMDDGTTTKPATFLPTPASERPGTPVPRGIAKFKRQDVLALLGAFGAALATTSLLVSMMPITGPIAWVALAYALFLCYYAVLVSLDEDGQVVRARIASAVIHTLSFVLLAVLVLVVSYTLYRGSKAMVHWNFYTEDMQNAGPLDPLTVGGIKHAIIGTLEQITMALLITVPLGVLCAVYLNEFPGRFSRFTRTVVEAMTALPSIIAGLFIYAVWILGVKVSVFGLDWTIIPTHEKSGFAASLAISVMMLPIIIRAADVVLRLVPGHLKEASYALGTSKWRTVWHVVLPTARSGLTTAVILGTARGIGETSPVLLTAGFNNAVNSDPSKGPQVSLPLKAFMDVRSPQDTMITRGFGTAAFLLVLVLVMFVIARALGGRGPGQLTSRQRRRILNASKRDAARYAARAGAVLAGLGLIGAALVHPAERAFAADNYVPISGAGSTWSQNALAQWIRNVNQYGLTVNYQGNGSSDGRNQFRAGTVDFAVSEIPYGLTDGGVKDVPPQDRKFAYMPIVAGGTAFMYNLKIGGKRVTNLRLSDESIARIFTGQAKTWNDAGIKKDNPGLSLPARRIVPVVRSDGSGTTAQLTTWLSKRYASLWDAYCKKNGRATPCGITSSFPVSNNTGYTAQSGSLGVSGYVSQEANDGTITYVEYSYAVNTGFPVAKMLNKKGYYVEPNAHNVAVGLLGAKINENASSESYLTQILDGVYDNPDARAYPLSSYSYMIVPTETTGTFNAAKGKSLGGFANYFLCEGQQQAEDLGYSPLPVNLVQAGLKQVKRIPGVTATTIDIKKCNNPTFSPTGKNLLAQNAPQPQACDKVGPVQCKTGTGGATTPTDTAGGDTGGTGTTGGGTGTTGGGTGGTGTTGGTGAPVVDPDTGQVISTGGAVGGVTPVGAESVNLERGFSEGMSTLLMVLAGLFVVGAILAPPLVSQLVRVRGGRS